MRIRILLILLACCFTGNATANDNDDTFALYLVRHAEKQSDGSRDPELTEMGKNRAVQLGKWLQDKNIVDVWTSDYKRILGTANPLLTELGLEVNIYHPGKLTALAEQLRNNHHNAFVVGHSNTVPELIANLGASKNVPPIERDEFDNIYIISIPWFGKTKTIRLRFGDPYVADAPA